MGIARRRIHPHHERGAGREPEIIIGPETLRALAREHRDLILSMRALTTLLREPETLSVAEAEEILARILDAELNQVSVLDGEIITAMRLEKGELGPVQPVDLGDLVRRAARRSGRMTSVTVRAPVVLNGHREIIEQEIESALALAHRIADGPVSASAERREGGGAIRLRTVTDSNELNGAGHDERIGMLYRMMRADGGRFAIEREADGAVTLYLSFHDQIPERD